MSYRLELRPRDVLFFKDARPMEASDAGHGGNWPRPDHLYNALHHAFLRQWPQMQEWEGELHTRRNEDKKDSSFRFGALKTVGPFPARTGELYFPTPLDWEMELMPLSGTDLPVPLTHAFRATSPEKRKYSQWITAEQYEKYLDGEFPSLKQNNDNALYAVDRNIGIAIDPESAATKDGAFYQAEYLRLNDKEGVTLAAEAECVIKPKRREGTIDVFARSDCPAKVIFGGQQGICSIACKPGVLRLPKTPEINTGYLRWTLLSPALFNMGWKPGWLASDGKVLLPRTVVSVEREPGMSREEWRKRKFATVGFNAKLVAARIGKPLAFSGWDERTGGPKPTVLAVPAGSCYVFKCESIDEAKALANVLNAPSRHSDLYGEKGFGIGVCSSIHVNE